MKRRFPAFASGRPALDKSGTGAYIADSLSDDELAEALRPARLRGLTEYVLDIPHADLLASAKSARAKSKSGEGFRHAGPLDVAHTIGGEGNTATPGNMALAFGAALASSSRVEAPWNRSARQGALLGSEGQVGYEADERHRRGIFGLADSETSGLNFPAFPQNVLTRTHVISPRTRR